MILKRIVILANSIKNQKRCVAGREVWFTNGICRVGDWVRPVTAVGKGEIALEQSLLPDGSQPRVHQVIEVPLLGHAGDPTQPENWHLAADRPWRLVSGAGAVPWELLHDKPPDLWNAWNQPTDRIAASALACIGTSPSLYLIRPRKFRLVVSTERDGHRRRRAVFEYGRHRYNLAVTDPTIDERHLNPYPTHAQGLRKVVLPARDDCFLCISRTPEFDDGYHYKIVATIIEPGD